MVGARSAPTYSPAAIERPQPARARVAGLGIVADCPSLVGCDDAGAERPSASSPPTMVRPRRAVPTAVSWRAAARGNDHEARTATTGEDGIWDRRKSVVSSQADRPATNNTRTTNHEPPAMVRP